MSEGGGGRDEIFVLFVLDKEKKIKTYLSVKEKWRENKQYYD